MLLSILGSLAIVFFFIAWMLVKNGALNKEGEALDIPGKEPEEGPPGSVKIIDVKDVPASEYDFMFSERPYNPYELYN
jgi:hypothetical protein